MSDVRRKLRDDAGEDYDKLKTALQQALNADKPVQRRCEHCGRSNTFHVPDNTSRLKAVELWVAQFGKPPAEEKEQELDLDIDITTKNPEERAVIRRGVIRILGPDHVAELMAKWRAAGERRPGGTTQPKRKRPG